MLIPLTTAIPANSTDHRPLLPVTVTAGKKRIGSLLLFPVGFLRTGWSPHSDSFPAICWSAGNLPSCPIFPPSFPATALPSVCCFPAICYSPRPPSSLTPVLVLQPRSNSSCGFFQPRKNITWVWLGALTASFPAVHLH